MKIEGTHYEIMLTSGGHHVYVRNGHGEPVVVAGPFPSHMAAADNARERAREQRAWRSFTDRPVGPRGPSVFWGP
ncbi:MAG TPA: hypothetical protein VLD13_11865 [Gaiellaceae bacterium]|nr:hypothetical protein [Gaiellaceae bacterium]